MASNKNYFCENRDKSLTNTEQENINVAIKCRPEKTIKKSYEKLLIG
jgi:hypothetical protein